jgi:Flp pilus assembly protein TadG
MKKFQRFLSECEAAEVAELAVVLPILFTLIFAIFSFGRAYNVYATVTRAAQEGARVAVTPACATCTTFTCGGTGSFYPCDATVAKAVTDAMKASNVDTSATRIVASSAPTVTSCNPPQPSRPCSQTNNIHVCRGVVLNSSSSTHPQACGTVVQFQYDYQFLPIPFVPSITRHMTARGQMWMEY